MHFPETRTLPYCILKNAVHNSIESYLATPGKSTLPGCVKSSGYHCWYGVIHSNHLPHDNPAGETIKWKKYNIVTDMKYIKYNM